MKRILIISVLAALAMQLSPAQAHERTARYLTPTTPGFLYTTPWASAGLDPGVGIGGYQFPAEGHAPTKAVVTDDLGTDVALAACQDVNADRSCDLANEPYARSCGNTILLPAFRANVPTTIFVKASEPVLCGDIGNTDYVATQGTIKLS